MDGWMNGWMKEWMNVWMNKWINEWMHEWMTEWVNERMKERKKERKNDRKNEWMDEWMNKWLDEWMNEWMNECMNEIVLMQKFALVFNMCFTLLGVCASSRFSFVYCSLSVLYPTRANTSRRSSLCIHLFWSSAIRFASLEIGSCFLRKRSSFESICQPVKYWSYCKKSANQAQILGKYNE